MNTNVNLEAAIGVLSLLATTFGLIVAALLLLYTLSAGQIVRAGKILSAMLLGVGLYAGSLLAFSLTSVEKTLARGEEKHFCEIDCHLAYSVADVQKTKTLDAGTQPQTARGEFYVVIVRTRFDEQTISPRRGNQPLWPNSRVATVFDAQGNRYEPSSAGRRALELSQGTGMPFTTPLRPGESYQTRLVFDLPSNVEQPRLLINEGDLVTHFIIGHENSPLHRKTQFQLEPQGGS